MSGEDVIQKKSQEPGRQDVKDSSSAAAVVVAVIDTAFILVLEQK